MIFPVLRFDFRLHPRLTDNVWQAQMAGCPKILTYNGIDPLARRDARRNAMRFDHDGARYEIPHIESRDEYPFACAVEGGARSWVGHVPPAENSAQGGLISAFLRQNGFVRGARFRVEPINHPQGRVTRPCRSACAGCPSPCRY